MSTIATSKDLCAGVDVGGTKVSSALFSAQGEMLDRAKVGLEKGGGEVSARQVADIVRRLEERAMAQGGTLRAVGLCLPGIVYQKTGRVWAPNIPGWDRFPLAEFIREASSIPLVLGSDRSAYVLGEQWRGAAQGLRDVVFLAVGTGIGAGILADGRVLRGAEDIAGAVGWFGLNPDFKKEYAEMGCFEAEASGGSVGRKARELLAGRPDSSLLSLAGGRVERVTAEVVVAAARAGDPLALKVVDEAVVYLAMGIANIVSILNPEIVVLGGGLFQAGALLLEPVRREFRKWAQPMAAQNVRLELSLLGEDAGLFGAGRLAWGVEKGEGSCRA